MSRRPVRGARLAGRARSIGAALLTSLALLAASGCEPVPEGATLAELAALRGRTFGTAVEPAHVGDAETATFLSSEFSVLTVENAMKWQVIHPSRDRYDFSGADAVVAAAEAAGLAVRGHTLVWHRQNPAWLESGAWTRAEAVALLREHIATVVGRYRGRVGQWDVVNEAIDDRGQLRDTIWLRTIGPEYIELAFRFAHEADPDALLFYNDYLIEHLGPKADAVEQLVADLRAAGAPIHGVGFQLHVLTPALMPSPVALRRQFARFADHGLDIAVTELDVALRLPTTPLSLQDQAEAFAAPVLACLAVPRCTTIVTWGWTDADSWIDVEFPGFGDGLLFDRAGSPKPAYERIRLSLWWNLRAPAG